MNWPPANVLLCAWVPPSVAQPHTGCCLSKTPGRVGTPCEALSVALLHLLERDALCYSTSFKEGRMPQSWLTRPAPAEVDVHCHLEDVVQEIRRRQAVPSLNKSHGLHETI